MKISYYTKLSGTSFRQDAVAELSKVKGTALLRVVPEPENEYDKYAVKVEAMLRLDSGRLYSAWQERDNLQSLDGRIGCKYISVSHYWRGQGDPWRQRGNRVGG